MHGVAAFKIIIIKKNTAETFFPEKMVTSLANIFTMEKLVVKIIFGSKCFICKPIFIFCGHFIDFWKAKG